MRRVRPLVLAGVTFGLLALTITGCGDDDSSSSSTTSGGDATTTTSGDATTTTGSTSSGSQAVSPDPSQPLTLRPGDKVSLVLESNPTTGYSWQVTVADESVARVASDNYLPPQSDAIGAGGKQAVEIEGVGDGTTTVQAVYLRSFEPDQPAQTETWTVEVGD